MVASQGWEMFHYSASDGLRLAGRKYGWNNVDPAPVVCLAGLTRNAADFDELAKYLASSDGGSRKVLCLDYRGRGQSEYDKNWRNYNPLVETDDVLAGITAAGIGHADIVGTSRGGIIAMILAAFRPGILKSVILNDIGPEIDGKGLIRIKNYISESRMPKNWDEATQYLKQVGKGDFTNWDDEEWRRQTTLIYYEKNGKLVRQHDPKLVNGLKDINLDIRLPNLWPQFAGLRKLPLLLIRGENTDLLSMDCVSRMQNEHQKMRIIHVPDQGHAPDLGSAGIPQTIASFFSNY